MNSFFQWSSYGKNNEITLLEKIIPIVIVIVIVSFIYFNRDKIRNNAKLDKIIRLYFCYSTVIFLVAYYYFEWSNNGIKISNLPLHLCFISAILASVVCIYKWKKLNDLLMYTGVLGGISSLIFPMVDLSWRYFRYYQFMIVHSNIIIIPIYFYIVYRYRLTLMDIITVYFIIQLLGICLGLFNEFFLTDYMFISFSSNFAAKNSVLITLCRGKNYFISLEILFSVVFTFWSLLLGYGNLINKILKNR